MMGTLNWFTAWLAGLDPVDQNHYVSCLAGLVHFLCKSVGSTQREYRAPTISFVLVFALYGCQRSLIACVVGGHVTVGSGKIEKTESRFTRAFGAIF